MTPSLVCLGGRDLEMVEISRLLAAREDVIVLDHQLEWGARASSYLDAIRSALAANRDVVLVELIDDLPADLPRETLVWIDHHGALAGRDRPTSIEQLFHHFHFPAEAWTRHLALVAANDRGHVAAMLELGATVEEARHIRALDREAQGIRPEEEVAGRLAALAAESQLGGRLTVVHLPHGRTATVTDVLDARLGGRGYESLLILSPGQTTFFGSGRAIDALRAAHPGGWYGGDLPERGYWGCPQSLTVDQVMPLLRDAR